MALREKYTSWMPHCVPVSLLGFSSLNTLESTGGETGLNKEGQREKEGGIRRRRRGRVNF